MEFSNSSPKQECKKPISNIIKIPLKEFNKNNINGPTSIDLITAYKGLI